MITLWGFDTVNTFKIAILLEEIGEAWDYVPINIRAGGQDTPEFRALNPRGKVPVIRDSDTGFVLTESGAILQVLAERYSVLIPSDPEAKARVLEWLAYQISTQGPFYGQIEYWTWLAPEPNPVALTHYLDLGQRILSLIDQRLGEAPWFAGDDYSIADIAFYAWLERSEKLGLDLQDVPNVRRWREGLATRDTVLSARQRIGLAPQDL